MNYNLTKPCADCPFRTDKPFYLAPERAEEIAEGITTQQGTFSCHKTLDYNEEDGNRETEKTEHCAGALIMLEHMEMPNQMMRICERLGVYDRTKLQMDSPVFEDADEFVDAMWELNNG